MAITLNSAAKIEQKSKVNPETGCWEWRGYVMRNGYGQVFFEGRMRLAHRASYKIHRGHIPRNLRVCHHCDNPRCVNPEHLFLGTSKDNTADMIAKGRQAGTDRTARKGELNGRAKLTEFDVIAIRSAVGPRGIQTKLAKQYGVGTTLISDLRAGRHWRCIEEGAK